MSRSTCAKSTFVYIEQYLLEHKTSCLSGLIHKTLRVMYAFKKEIHHIVQLFIVFCFCNKSYSRFLFFNLYDLRNLFPFCGKNLHAKNTFTVKTFNLAISHYELIVGDMNSHDHTILPSHETLF